LVRVSISAALAAGLAFATVAFAQEASPAVDLSQLPYASTKDSALLPDGRTIHLVCMGQGSPVVILTAGSGNWSNIWNKVQPEVAQKTRVCAWDRAGFGLSSPSPKRQTVDNRTTDLQAALKADHIDGPYVVVGHSLGGYESLLLKDREPKKVVGMVLVDASFPGQSAAFRHVAPALMDYADAHPSPLGPYFLKCAADVRAGTVWYGKPDPNRCMAPPRPPTFPPELRAALDKAQIESGPAAYARLFDIQAFYAGAQLLERDSEMLVKPDRNYGAMPLIVLTAGATEPPEPDIPEAVKAQIPLQRAEWLRAHDALAKLSARGVNRVVPDSTHYIHQLKPQLVIDAIDEVVDEARGSGKAH